MKIFFAWAFMVFSSVFPILAWSHENHPPAAALLQRSPVTLATVTALELFEQKSAGSVWSFKSEASADDVEGEILYINAASAVHALKYDCHFHNHDSQMEAHCHDFANAPSALNPTEPLNFTVDNFIAALTSALDILDRKVTPVENVVALKSWQAAGQMHLNLTYKSNASGTAVSYYMCHFHHGPEIDCHRALNPGPQEPQF